MKDLRMEVKNSDVSTACDILSEHSGSLLVDHKIALQSSHNLK